MIGRSLVPAIILAAGIASAAQAAPDGAKVYADNCLACHMADGMGVPRFQPPLVGGKWVKGDPQTLAAFVMTGGFDSANRIDGQGENTMPNFSHLDNASLAAVLTYIRDKFGGHAGPVTVADVKAARATISTK